MYSWVMKTKCLIATVSQFSSWGWEKQNTYSTLYQNYFRLGWRRGVLIPRYAPKFTLCYIRYINFIMWYDISRALLINGAGLPAKFILGANFTKHFFIILRLERFLFTNMYGYLIYWIFSKKTIFWLILSFIQLQTPFSKQNRTVQWLQYN